MTDEQRAEMRGMQAAIDAVGREIARQRDAGASDAVLLALVAGQDAIKAEVRRKLEALGFRYA